MPTNTGHMSSASPSAFHTCERTKLSQSDLPTRELAVFLVHSCHIIRTSLVASDNIVSDHRSVHTVSNPIDSEFIAVV